MYHLHAFMVINALVDNTLGTVSPLGELSPKSRSYSREVGIYTDEEYDDVRLMVFYSHDDDNKVTLSQTLAKVILGMGDWLAKESTLNRIDSDRSGFIQKITAEYAGRIKIIEVGKMVTNGTYWLPEYITFSLTSDSRPNRYKVWFADEAFQNQYDKYEIEVIPPIVNIDDFHKGVVTVRRTLTNHNVTNLHNRVNEASKEKPYTYIVTPTYSYINPEDKKDITPTSWTVIIYGEAGNNADIIRDALADYVLKNSDFPRDKWEAIIPDLFIPTEFYLCPFWTKYATENLQLKGGIYSPIVPYRDIIPYALKTMYGYNETHIKENVVVFNSIFKSIAVIACGHEKNRAVDSKFEKVWKDYCNIYTTSRDFNRISPETQEFILFMNKMLVEAETVTPNTDVPVGMSRVIRGDYYYLSAQFDAVTYLVPLRYNFLNEITLDKPSSIALSIVNPTGTRTTDTGSRINNIVNMTPVIGLPPGTQRGRTTLHVQPGVGGDTIATTVVNNGDGLAGTPTDRTDGTEASVETGRS